MTDAPGGARGGTVFVTGASSGIGEAAAAELAGKGYTVGCFSRRGTTPPGEGLVPLAGDVTDRDRVSEAIEELVALGPLRGVVSCAGRYLEIPSAEMTSEHLRDLFELNVFAAFDVCRLAYPHLVASGGGTIVTIGSFYDTLGVAKNTAYAASKAALGSVARCLGVEWARDSIQVVNVAPGYVRTELNDDFFTDDAAIAKVARRIPAGRIGEAPEIGRLIASVITGDVPFMTANTIYVDGGQGVTL